MSKGSFANEDIMEEYLQALLTEGDAEEIKETHSPILKTTTPKKKQAEQVTLAEKAYKNPVEQLLKQVRPSANMTPVAEEKASSAPITRETIKNKVVVESTPEVKENQLKVALQASDTTEIPPPIKPTETKDYHLGDFQALFFDVAGLTLAVPLTELGGIHKLNEVSPLFGKPAWFKGIMLNKALKINVVDSALWVMPEKCNEALLDKLNYQYVIMLGESNWGLACERLINNVTLSQDAIKWRAKGGKRPWLAGLVKEKMCALLDVEQLIVLLNKGLDSQDVN